MDLRGESRRERGQQPQRLRWGLSYPETHTVRLSCERLELYNNQSAYPERQESICQAGAWGRGRSLDYHEALPRPKSVHRFKNNYFIIMISHCIVQYGTVQYCRNLNN